MESAWFISLTCVECDVSNALKVKSSEEIERKLRKRIGSQQEQELKTFSTQQKKDYKSNIDRLKQVTVAHILPQLTYMRIGEERGDYPPSLGYRKRLLVSDFWKINYEF